MNVFTWSKRFCPVDMLQKTLLKCNMCLLSLLSRHSYCSVCHVIRAAFDTFFLQIFKFKKGLQSGIYSCRSRAPTSWFSTIFSTRLPSFLPESIISAESFKLFHWALPTSISLKVKFPPSFIMIQLNPFRIIPKEIKRKNQQQFRVFSKAALWRYFDKNQNGAITCKLYYTLKLDLFHFAFRWLNRPIRT